MGDEGFQLVTSQARLMELAQHIKQNITFSVTMYDLLMIHALGYHSATEIFEMRTPTSNYIILSRRKNEPFDEIYVYCEEPDVPLTIEVLRRTQFLDWTNPFLFVHLPNYMEEGMRRLVEGRVEGEVNVYLLETYVFLEKEELEEVLRCPPGVRMCCLGDTGVRQMHAAWRYNKHVDLNTFLSMSQHPTSVGVYEAKREDREQTTGEGQVADHEITIRTRPLERAGDDEKALAWVALTPFGSSGMLHTEESHRRKGFARLAMKVFSRLQDQQGLVPVAFIEKNNEGSRKLFHGLPGWREVPRTLVVGVNCDI